MEVAACSHEPFAKAQAPWLAFTMPGAPHRHRRHGHECQSLALTP